MTDVNHFYQPLLQSFGLSNPRRGAPDGFLTILDYPAERSWERSSHFTTQRFLSITKFRLCLVQLNISEIFLTFMVLLDTVSYGDVSSGFNS